MAVNNNYLYSDLTEKIIRAATKVHRSLGPGLVEKLYQRALKIELTKDGLQAKREHKVEMQYEGVDIGFDKADFDVENKVLVELKAVSSLNDIHRAQMISYLRTSKRRIGLIINFANTKLEIKRIIV